MLVPEQISNAKIIFSPLNWGMGHVSRSIPILQQLLQQNNSIIVFCSAEQEGIYTQYFNELHYERHEPYDFSFQADGFKLLGFMARLPKLIQQHTKEKQRVKTYLWSNPTDYIISDQRFGFRNKSVFSIFITHQCVLPIPWYFGIGQLLNRYLIGRFDQTWIVDDVHKRFAGNLSRRLHTNHAYLGLKSRFPIAAPSGLDEKHLQVLVFNGPREFHPLLIEAFHQDLEQIDVIIGERHKGFEGKLHISSWKEADEVLRKASVIYSFSGYSTLMDVVQLGCAWKCIPTPGQKEQEYIYKKTLAKGLGFYNEINSD